MRHYFMDKDLCSAAAYVIKFHLCGELYCALSNISVVVGDACIRIFDESSSGLVREILMRPGGLFCWLHQDRSVLEGFEGEALETRLLGRENHDQGVCDALKTLQERTDEVRGFLEVLRGLWSTTNT